ncbi:MAG: hypothetical protein HC812_19110 [Leptolyngbya sp. RL_3_1]|nr:hypothetical protein [Leptolyngbya sp. RL_3_1]
MQYRNITDQPLPVKTAVADLTVQPGDTVLTAPRFANALVEAGQLEPVPVTQPKTTRKTAKETAE